MTHSSNKLFIPLLFLLLSFASFGQTEPCDCSDGTPTTEAQLLAGGSFCGNTTIDVGGTFDPVNEICWSSGTLTLTGNDADVNFGGIFQVTGGTIDLDGDTNQDIDILSGGNLIVGDGAVLFVTDQIDVNNGGNMTVQGTVTSNTGDIRIFAGGTVTVDGNGLLTAAVDIEADGGTLNVLGSNGTATAGDDIKAFNGGTVYVSQNGTINTTGNLVTSSNGTGSVNSTGTIIIDGTANVGGNVVITGNGTGSGSGTINVTGTFTDNSGDNNFGCVGTVCTGTNTPLPVELIDFFYEINNNLVVLYWSTASELNNLGFSVEKSADGETFDQIAFVDGNGTTNEVREYKLIETASLSGGVYYRLKQVDYDGAFEYSKILFVNSGNSVNYQLTTYPNPTKGNITLSIGLTNYSLYNAQGQLLLKNDNTTSFFAEQQISEILSKADKGVYFLKSKMEGQTLSLRILKQ